MSFEIHFTNIRGFKSNFNSIEAHLANCKPAVLSLGEVQVINLGDPDDFQCPGYSRIDVLVPHRGIIIFIRNDVRFNIPSFLAPSLNPAFNTLWVEIKISTHSIFICTLYRSPNLSHADTCFEFDKISDSIDKIYQLSSSAEIVVLGDFNVHNDTWLTYSHGRDQSGETAELFADQNLLSQLVDQPTRYPDKSGQAPHLLDLFLTTLPNKYSVDVGPPLGRSDHALITSKFPLTPDALEPVPARHFWYFEKADWIGLNTFFKCFPWESCFLSKDTDEIAKSITSTILLGIKKFIPSSWKTPTPLKNNWLNAKCRQAIFMKKTTHSTYLKIPSDENLAKFRLARNKANALINKAKIEYNHKIRNNIRKVLNSSTSNRTFWSFAGLIKRNFNGKTSSIPNLYYNDNCYKTSSEKANLLASQFALASTLLPLKQDPPILPTVTTSMPKINFRIRVVCKVLSQLNPNKATGPDGIPSIVLKHCHTTLASPLSKMFYLSMKTGIFPSIWKTANIQPVPKKGDKTSSSNYRPIALLSVVSKVMESIVNFKLTKYLDDNQLISDFQYGFRKQRSAGDLMTYLVHCWERSIERFGETSVVSLDISKAFDRVWHECLISKLRSLNVHSSLIQWLTNYLSKRKIQVLLDGVRSDSYDINAGVPQGSSLSPTLFLVYINDLLLSSSCNIHSFADDTTLSASIEFCNLKDCRTNLENFQNQMSTLILENTKSVLEWGRLNRVEFNPKKFQACLFSQKLTQHCVTPVIGDVPIERCPSLKMLGLEITSDLSWKDHIYSIAKKASQCLGFVRRCNFYFSAREMLRLYKAYVRPLLEYNSFVWGGAPKTHLVCLDKIQNRVIKMIDDDSITKYLEPLEQRRNISALTVFYKYYFGHCSLEISSLIPPPRIARANTRFNSQQHPYAVELYTCRTSHFKSSFFPRVTSMWNQLDESVFPRSYNSQVFKKNLSRWLQDEKKGRF